MADPIQDLLARVSTLEARHRELAVKHNLLTTEHLRLVTATGVTRQQLAAAEQELRRRMALKPEFHHNQGSSWDAVTQRLAPAGPTSMPAPDRSRVATSLARPQPTGRPDAERVDTAAPVNVMLHDDGDEDPLAEDDDA